MATLDFMLWLISYMAENLCGLKCAGICSTATLQGTRGVAINSGAEMSLQGLQASLMHFAGPIWDRSKWFDSDKHAQLTADAYNAFVVMVTYEYRNIVIRAPSSFRPAEAIRAAIPTARLLGMVFSGCGGAGHWDSIDIEKARELLGKRGYAGVCISRVR